MLYSIEGTNKTNQKQVNRNVALAFLDNEIVTNIYETIQM